MVKGEKKKVEKPTTNASKSGERMPILQKIQPSRKEVLLETQQPREQTKGKIRGRS
jgi:hypothetical protein